MRRRLGICIALLLALPPAAAAQRENETLVVEGGGTRVLAELRSGRQLCLTVEYPRGTGGLCTERVSAREPEVAAFGGVTAGVVVAEVERVEVEWPDGVRTDARLASHPDFPGVRFLLAVHGTRHAFLVRTFAADGSLLAVEQVGDGPKVAGPVTLASGRRWKVTGWLERVLAPGPGAPERTEVVACVGRRSRTSSGTQCLTGEPLLAEPISGEVFATELRMPGEKRRPHRMVVAALLGPAATRVDVDLGSGRRERAKVRELQGAGASGRFAVYTARSADAIRRLVVRDAAGAELDQQVVTLAPGALGHFGHADLFSLRPPTPGTAEVAAGPVKDGEGVLKVREVGARLCAEVENSYAPGAPCGFPSSPHQSLLVGGASANHGVVGGVVPPEVATVELEEINGFAGPEPATVRVATQAPAPYAGAFAPHVRTFVALLPVGDLVVVRLLDAQGEELHTTSVEAYDHSELTTPRRPRTRLRIGPVRLLAHPGSTECVHFRDTGADLLHQSCASSREEVDVHVACRPGATVVVLPAKGRPGAVVRTARGRLVRPRRLRLGGATHLVFAVRSPDTPRAVAWRGGRVALGRLPSPRRQCGYRVRLELDLGGPGG